MEENGVVENGVVENQNKEQEVKNESLTKEDILQLIQIESDKRVTSTLATQQKKHEKELTKQKSLSGMDTEARAKTETKLKIQELEEELEKYRLSNTKAEIGKVLSNRNLSVELVDLVVTSTDTDECMEKIETLDKLFKAAVKKEVENRLRGTSPKNTTAAPTEGSITRESFKKMSLSQQHEIYVSDKELYMELTKK